MTRIALEDGTFALSATPDPQKVVDAEWLQIELQQKQNELIMYENEIENLINRKESLQADIDEINLIINNI